MNPEHLALLVKTEWQLSYVTPLCHFRHTQLKSYSRQLSAFIAAEKQQGLAVEVDGLQSNFKVSFSVLRGMAATDNDPETVFIQVYFDYTNDIILIIDCVDRGEFINNVFFPIAGPFKAIVCKAG